MAFDWLLSEPLPAGVPRQRVLYHRLREAILSARLPAGTRLPASRSLAATLGIARNTVLFAYEQLVAEGCLVADRQGTCVARLAVRAEPPAASTRVAIPALHLSARAASGAAAASRRATPKRCRSRPACRISAPFPSAPGVLASSAPGATPAGGSSAMPRTAAIRRCARRSPATSSSVRGLAVDAAQIVVTSGTQAALDLCARLLADHGDTVWVENPGYLAARVAFGLAGLRVHDVAVDGDGPGPRAEDWQHRRPRLVMVTPSHQYPTGRVMSLARRLALIERARAAGAWIVEDDYDSEFRRAGPAPPALFGLHADAPVVYAGTFSKTLYPGLRLGYLVLPRTSRPTSSTPRRAPPAPGRASSSARSPTSSRAATTPPTSAACAPATTPARPRCAPPCSRPSAPGWCCRAARPGCIW
jgi:GntR family transcriptional regulator/MocR family aminotransferase